eukprot:4248292-Pyramimonas_sp.AAC.1
MGGARAASRWQLWGLDLACHCAAENGETWASGCHEGGPTSVLASRPQVGPCGAPRRAGLSEGRPQELGCGPERLRPAQPHR